MSSKTKNSDSIPLKRVLYKVLSKDKLDNLLSGVDIAYSSVKDIHENAVYYLSKGKTEPAIKCIIFGLELDRNYGPLLVLCRTMLYGLSKKLSSNKAIDITRRYENLKKSKKLLNQQIEGLETKIEELNKQLDDIQTEFENMSSNFFDPKNFLFINYFRKKKLDKQVEELKKQRWMHETKIEAFIKEIDLISKIEIIEEYASVLKLILEVCVFPQRYVSLLN